MFDFERMDVYHKAVSFFSEIQQICQSRELHYYVKDQLYRAGMSVVINIAEGAGRRTHRDKRHFFVISRGSVFESVAILGLVRKDGLITGYQYDKLYHNAEELSKMLYSLIRKLGK